MKNKNNILPLSKNINRLFITGPNAANVNTLLANYNGLSPNIVTPLEGITAKVSNGTIIRFNKGVDLISDNNRMDWSASLAGSSDVTVAVMGISALIEGEEGAAISSAANGDRNTISLPKNQIEYLKKLRIYAAIFKLWIVLFPEAITITTLQCIIFSTQHKLLH